MLVQRVLASFHDGEYFLLLQSSADDLHADGQAGHLCCVVVLVCAAGDAIQISDVEGWREGVFGGVDVRYGDDAGGVVEL